jgi:hypothetical protein
VHKSRARLASEIARRALFLVLTFATSLRIIAVEWERTPPILCAGLVRFLAADELARASFFTVKTKKTDQFFPKSR